MMLQNVLKYIKIVLMICTMHLRQPPSPGVRPWERNMRLMLHLRGKILISCLTSKSNLSFKTCRPIHHYFPYYCTRSLLGLFSHLGRLDFRHFFRAQSCLIEFHRAVFTWLSKGIGFGFGFGFTTPFGWLVYLLWFWFYDSQVKTALKPKTGITLANHRMNQSDFDAIT